MNRLIESIFQNRHYTDEFLKDIDTKTHKAPLYTDELCQSLKVYHDNRYKLVLVVDFDTDGIMCGIEGFAGLAELGFNVSLYFLNVNNGYGFKSADIDRIKLQYPDVRGILTGDVGITCFDGIARAKKLGLDVFVTDHHIPNMAALRYQLADIVVDPMTDVVEAQIEDRESDVFGSICGAHVMWKLLHHYAKYYTGVNSAYMVSQIDRLRVFAGFGTISDAMPLYYENRELVRDMIDICKAVYPNTSDLVDSQSFINHIPGCDQYRRAFLGLYTLLDVFHEKNAAIFGEQNTIQEDFVGFYLAPTLNSIKRLHMPVEMAYGVFFGPTPRENMIKLYELNEERKVSVIKHMAEIDEIQQEYAPYIYFTDAVGGLRGLLAQQLMNRHNNEHPVIVVAQNADGSYSGSGRSPSWYKFLEYAVSPNWWAAGHNPSFGFGTGSELGLDELYDFLKTDVDKKRELLLDAIDVAEETPDYIVSMFDDNIHYDLETIDEYLVQKEYLRPFGQGFPKPLGILKVDTKNIEVQLIGKALNSNNPELKPHVKLRLPMGVEVLCWNQGSLFYDRLKKIVPAKDDEEHLKPYYVLDDSFDNHLDVLGDFEYGYFNDVKSIQFKGNII